MHVRDLPPGAWFDKHGQLRLPKEKKGRSDTSKIDKRARQYANLPRTLMLPAKVVVSDLRIVSEANQRGEWKRIKRKNAQQVRLWAKFWSMRERPKLPVVVTVTRLAPRMIRDRHDNLRSGFKGVIDEIARWLGCDDGSDAVRWVVEQQKHGGYGIEILIEIEKGVRNEAGEENLCRR